MMELTALVLSGATAALTLAWVVIGIAKVRRQDKEIKTLKDQNEKLSKARNELAGELSRISSRVTAAEKKTYKLEERLKDVQATTESVADEIDYTTRELEVVRAVTQAPAPATTPKPARRPKVKVYTDDDYEEDEEDGVYPAQRDARELRGPGRGQRDATTARRVDSARRGRQDRSRDVAGSRYYR